MDFDKDIQYIALEIGAKMIENGAEICRAEDTVKRILRAKGVQKIEVFCLSSVILVSADGKVMLSRIRKNDPCLSEIDRLNALSRALCEGKEFTYREQRYPLPVKLVSVVLGTGSFCLFFGGSLYDALLAGLIGILLTLLPHIISTQFAKTLFDAALAGCLSFLFSFVVPHTHPDKMMLGTIMLLVPGLTVSGAIRDIMSADILSGIMELTEAVFTALAIALGFAFAVVIFK